MSIPTLNSFTRDQRSQITRRTQDLYRFADGPDVERAPAAVRVGFTRAEWLALSPEDRRLYIRAVIRIGLRRQV